MNLHGPCLVVSDHVGSYDQTGDNVPEIEVIVGVCAGLVKIEEGRAEIVQLAHYSIQVYLEKLPVGKDWIHMSFQVLKDCIDYLVWRIKYIHQDYWSFTLPGWMLTPETLQQYISNNLDFHVQSCDEDVITTLLLSPPGDPRSSVIHRWGSGRFTNLKTSLDKASYLGHVPSIRHFITPNLKHSTEVLPHPTVLYIAACRGHVSAMRAILGAAYSVDEHLELSDEDGDHVVTALYGATRAEEADTVRFLLEQGADMYATFTLDRSRSDLFWGPRPSGFSLRKTSVFRASTSSLLRALRFPYALVPQVYLERNRLIRASWTLSSEPSMKPQRLLCLALRNGVCDAAEFLMQRGCDYEQGDDLGRTAIFHAISQDAMRKTVPYLARIGARFDITDNDGRTLLHYLCQPSFISSFRWGTVDSYVHCIKLLLAHGIKVNTQDGSGMTHLHVATESNLPGIAGTLIRCGAYISARCHRRLTPLDYIPLPRRVEAAYLT